MVSTGQADRDFVRRFLATPARSDAPELMDAPGLDPDELADNLRDIRRVNRLLGGTAIILEHLPGLIALAPPGQHITILDLATGSADIPLAIAVWARHHNAELRITASDVSEEMLSQARRQIAGHPDITLARYDGRDVPLPDNAFDIVLCSLSLHHLSPEDGVRMLREMDRLARLGFIVNDLRRTRRAHLGARLAGRFTTRNRLTRHDAPLSVLRAYTPDELRDLLRLAGVHDATITKHRWFRMAAVKRNEARHA